MHKTSFKKQNIVPIYKQLSKYLMEEIKGGRFSKGSKLLSEINLADKYSISRTTVRKALNELINEKLLVRQQGKGTFVANPQSEKRTSKNIGLYLMSWYKGMPDIEKVAFFTSNYQPDMAFIKRYTYYATLHGITNSLIKRFYYPVFMGRKGTSFSLAKQEQANTAGVILETSDENGEKHQQFIIQELKTSNIPYITVNRYSLQKDTNYVEQYAAEEIYKASRYLLELGHRRIAGIGYKSRRLCYNNPFYGFQKALEEKDIYDPLLVKKLTKNTEEELLPVVENLFSGKNPPTAIFLFWELATISLISALEKYGIKIPEDVSLMAVGHEQVAINGLKVTTIGDNSSIEFGETVANKLIDLIEEKIQPPVNTKMKLKLLEGNSCRRIKEAIENLV